MSDAFRRSPPHRKGEVGEDSLLIGEKGRRMIFGIGEATLSLGLGGGVPPAA